jgi:hypothetical protein
MVELVLRMELKSIKSELVSLHVSFLNSIQQGLVAIDSSIIRTRKAMVETHLFSSRTSNMFLQWQTAIFFSIDEVKRLLGGIDKTYYGISSRLKDSLWRAGLCWPPWHPSYPPSVSSRPHATSARLLSRHFASICTKAQLEADMKSLAITLVSLPRSIWITNSVVSTQNF